MKNLIAESVAAGTAVMTAIWVLVGFVVVLAAAIVAVALLKKKVSHPAEEQQVAVTAAEPVEQPVEEPVEDSQPAEEPVEEPQPVEQSIEPQEPQQQPVQPEVERSAPAPAVTIAVKSAEVKPQADRPRSEAAGPQTVVRYNKSFMARLIQSKPQTKQFFAEVANYLAGYGLRSRQSWHCLTFYKGREAQAKLNVRGKSLCVYLALDPFYADAKYHVQDASDVKRFQAVPLFMWVRSNRGVKYAKELVDVLAQQNGLTSSVGNVFSADDYPYQTTPQLVERKLIKVKILQGDGEGEIVSAPIKVVSAVTVEQAEEMMSDVTAATMVERVEGERTAGKKYIVNVDTLSAHFQSGETVNLRTLKERGLVPNKAGTVKVLARGMLDKALTVEAADFSLDAVKMIVLTGGKAVRLG